MEETGKEEILKVVSEKISHGLEMPEKEYDIHVVTAGRVLNAANRMSQTFNVSIVEKQQA